MNILSEQQARARQLALPHDGLLTGVSDEFITELQNNGTFVEYNQQTIVNAGQPADYMFCVISGQVDLYRRNEEFGRSRVATLGAGQWYGVREVFQRVPADEEAFAQDEVILWTIPPDTLRDLFFTVPAAVQLLFNFGILLTQKLAAKAPAVATPQ
ncbi:MAG TPA: cyclic nucleotide-binding domain-containing protein [Chthoniobacterales bacterium]|jgi:CRP-like cAMP-binding protein|nr:cyclic nucleotide-binding domain-containing protein [Chthoniobacterales bacterium]